MVTTAGTVALTYSAPRASPRLASLKRGRTQRHHGVLMFCYPSVGTGFAPSEFLSRRGGQERTA